MGYFVPQQKQNNYPTTADLAFTYIPKMKTVGFMATVAFMALFTIPASALPADYKDIDYTKINYPEGTGENLPSYPAPAGGWEDVPYPPGTGEMGTTKCSNGPFAFTSIYHVIAIPDQVVNGTTNPQPTGGLSGAVATFDLGINSALDLICYRIMLKGFRGQYQSPARTATHIHQAARGQNGPPRLAFPNPVGEGNERSSYGCMIGPFTTGVNATDGSDTGMGFMVKQIEEDPSAFFVDIHSSLAVPGAVRGQID